MLKSSLVLASLLAATAVQAQLARSARPPASYMAMQGSPAEPEAAAPWMSPYAEALDGNTLTAIDIQESHHGDGANGG